MQGGRDGRFFSHCRVYWQEDWRILSCTKTDLGIYTLGTFGVGDVCTYRSLGGRRKDGQYLCSAGVRNAKSALYLLQFPRGAAEGSKVSEGNQVLSVSTCAETFFPCFPSPICLV